MPYSEYRGAQLPCTVEYCKHHGKADSFPAATCAATGVSGEWVTRPTFIDESSSGGLSTEEKYLCTVASIADIAGTMRTYLARTDAKRSREFVQWIRDKTREGEL